MSTPNNDNNKKTKEDNSHIIPKKNTKKPNTKKTKQDSSHIIPKTDNKNPNNKIRTKTNKKTTTSLHGGILNTTNQFQSYKEYLMSMIVADFLNEQIQIQITIDRRNQKKINKTLDEIENHLGTVKDSIVKKIQVYIQENNRELYEYNKKLKEYENNPNKNKVFSLLPKTFTETYKNFSEEGKNIIDYLDAIDDRQITYRQYNKYIYEILLDSISKKYTQTESEIIFKTAVDIIEHFKNLTSIIYSIDSSLYYPIKNTFYNEYRSELSEHINYIYTYTYKNNISVEDIIKGIAYKSPWSKDSNDKQIHYIPEEFIKILYGYIIFLNFRILCCQLIFSILYTSILNLSNIAYEKSFMTKIKNRLNERNILSEYSSIRYTLSKRLRKGYSPDSILKDTFNPSGLIFYNSSLVESFINQRIEKNPNITLVNYKR